MKRIYAISLSLALAFTVACSKKKGDDDASGDAEQAAKSDKPTEVGTGDAGKAPTTPKKLTETYPPSIGVYPLSAPDPGRSLYFGFTAGGTPAYQMIWVYAVAAVPDFDQAVEDPGIESQADFDAFMEKWAAEFKANPAFVAALDKLAAEFSFKTDPAFFTDAAYTIPAASLGTQPEYVKITQKYFARRYTTKAAGSTTISATVDGATLSVPVVITAYDAATLAAGKTRYEAVNNAANQGVSGCINCHGSASANKDAFLKHSSDYLAYATDTEILDIVTKGTYPNGAALTANGLPHVNTITAGAQTTGIIGYLRSFPPSMDKLESVPAQPAALRLH